MSFYDLTKDFVLSAKELFKYRVKRDNTIPSRGGQKDFEPDGSWIQTKALEAFMQERTSVLSEPRVEKLKNLVEGVWDQDQGLVNIKKPGKFWAHMGFTDQRRNWLYPEEALFLMECNNLEVYNQGVPLSIQEAYNKFLGSQVSMEEYQVFAHLRRLGYVVMRHEEQPLITAYERQINLDKYITKQNRKDRRGKFLKKGKKFKQSTETIKNLDESGSKDHPLSSTADNSVRSEKVDSNKLEESTPADCATLKEASSKVKDDACSITENTNEPSDIRKSTEDSLQESDPACLPTNPNSSPTGSDTDSKTLIDGTKNENSNTDFIPSERRKRHRSSEDESATEPVKKIHKDDAQIYERVSDSPPHNSAKGDEYSDSLQSSEQIQDSATSVQLSSSCGFYNNAWASCFQSIARHHQSCGSSQSCEDNDVSIADNNLGDKIDNASVHHTSCTKSCLTQTVWDFRRGVPLPNIANRDMLSLTPPDSKLLPASVEIDGNQDELLLYDVEDYRFQNPPPHLSRQAQREEERDTRIRGLQFSFADWMQQKPKVTATNWREYKQKVAERTKEISSSTPVEHLWQGKITPLVRPENAWSNKSILDRLSIIQSADNETLLPDSDCLVDIKVTYDVHLPDSKFKKSMPGVPNHRVCVTKCSDDPPGLAELQQVWSRFKDGIPLHWAVVDSGEIAFYVFDNSHSLEVLP